MIRKFAGLMAVTAGTILAQTASPTFEVASVKQAAPSPMGHMSMRMSITAGRVNYSNVTLKDVLARAYNLKRYQIGGPSWLDSERYDITAKVPDGVPREQVPAMLQALLAERFKMTVHKESKEESVYALVVGKNGPKLKKSEEDKDAAPPAAGGSGAGGPVVAGAAGGRGRSTTMMSGNGKLEAKRVKLGVFTDMLANMLGRPVIDKTNLEGQYDITLEVSPEDIRGMHRMAAPPAAAMGEGAGAGTAGPGAEAPAPERAPGGSLFSAVQQLGLKLESQKGPVERLVVDSAEKVPTEN